MLRSLQQLLFRKLKNVLITWYCYKIIGCLIDTMRKYLINPSPQKQLSDSGILKSVTVHDLQKIRTILHNHSGHTSKPISKEAEIPETPNATRNRLLRAMANNRAPAAKRTSLTTSGYIECARTYMEQACNTCLFRNETCAILDGQDGWAKGWILTGDQRHHRAWRQQGGGGAIWFGKNRW